MPLHETPAGPVETLEWGEGPEVMLLLHAAASSPHALAGLAERLAVSGRRVIAPMLNGYGRTAMRSGGGPVAAHLAVAAECLDLYPAERRTLFGHSMGGLIALETAMRAELLEGVILYEPIVVGALDLSDPEDRAARDRDRAVVEMLETALGKDDAEAGVAHFVEAWNEAAWDEIPAAARARLVAAAPVLAAETRAVNGHPLDRKAVAAIPVPVTVLHGSASPDLSGRMARRLSALLPRGRIETLRGLGHMGPVLDPDRVAALVEEIMREPADRCR